MKPNLPKDNEIKQQLTLINFNQDYYYDIKLILEKILSTTAKKVKTKSKKVIDEDVKLDSKSSIEKAILDLEAKLTEYDDDQTEYYQNYLTSIKNQIKFYQSELQKLNKK